MIEVLPSGRRKNSHAELHRCCSLVYSSHEVLAFKVHGGPLERTREKVMKIDQAVEPNREDAASIHAELKRRYAAVAQQPAGQFPYHGFDNWVSSQVMTSTSAGPAAFEPEPETTARARCKAGPISAGWVTRSATTPRPSATLA